jgi:hypothetical protein
MDALQQQVDESKEEIDRLKSQLESEMKKNQGVECQLDQKRDDALKQELKELESLYKLTTLDVGYLGVAAVVASLSVILGQMEEFAQIIKKYSPINDTLLNQGLFTLFIILLAMTAKKYFESHIVQRKAREITTPLFHSLFLDDLRAKKSIDPENIIYFTESEAFKFIAGEQKWWKKLLSTVGFRLFQLETTSLLAHLFIADLLAKKLIAIGGAEMLDRTFRIRTKATSYYDGLD